VRDLSSQLHLSQFSILSGAFASLASRCFKHLIRNLSVKFLMNASCVGQIGWETPVIISSEMDQ